jgi:hypothetical protein
MQSRQESRSQGGLSLSLSVHAVNFLSIAGVPSEGRCAAREADWLQAGNGIFESPMRTGERHIRFSLGIGDLEMSPLMERALALVPSVLPGR